MLLLLEELARQAAHRNEPHGANASAVERRERSLSGVNAAADAPTLTLALVHLPTQEENRRFLLLVGSGAPDDPSPTPTPSPTPSPSPTPTPNSKAGTRLRPVTLQHKLADSVDRCDR